ncbi:simple sugar transport system permease protein [Agrobacterium larrymoorei]|uniref:Simple sugar transport system permease protein n=1 Tax=Agrobacterium larrymoorei TaxID=160699 RepID=A0AAJ2BE99_9HYPH|nr:ABC transporter permease [Agrobacterium larrymoorei]MDR6102228.1 simple sugar transport system permease protein [Agrobacterium larrymoorei]
MGIKKTSPSATRHGWPTISLDNRAIAFLMLILLCIVTAAINPAFLSVSTLFDTLRNLTVIGIFGMAALIVMLTGGIDVSFPAIGAVTAYATIKYFVDNSIDAPLIAIYGVAMLLGGSIGLINGLFVALLRLPALIVTLGMSSLLYGFSLFFLGSQNIFRVPASLSSFSRTALMTWEDVSGRTLSLHPAVLIFVGVCVLVGLMLRYTIIGRGLYALGGNRESARRIGLPVKTIEIFAFVAAGVLAAMAGITQSMFFRNANPGAFSGMELDVIAAIVLGGASVTGGRGSVAGAVIGLTFVVLLTSSLVLIGIPAAWQKVFVGAALLLGVGVAGLRATRAQAFAPIPFSRMRG